MICTPKKDNDKKNNEQLCIEVVVALSPSRVATSLDYHHLPEEENETNKPTSKLYSFVWQFLSFILFFSFFLRMFSVNRIQLVLPCPRRIGQFNSSNRPAKCLTQVDHHLIHHQCHSFTVEIDIH